MLGENGKTGMQICQSMPKIVLTRVLSPVHYEIMNHTGRDDIGVFERRTNERCQSKHPCSEGIFTIGTGSRERIVLLFDGAATRGWQSGCVAVHPTGD